MADAALFIQKGWRNIWKQKTIWFFSLLPVFFRSIIPNYNRGEENLSFMLLYLILVITQLLFWGISLIGVPYQAYTYSIGTPATIRETFAAVHKYSLRIIGCSCVVVFFMMLCLLFVIAIALQRSPSLPQAVNNAIIIFLPFSIFASLVSFTIYSIFANDWGIRKSLENSWNLFKLHFGVLAILGLGFAILWKMSSGMAGIFIVLIQSEFDASSIRSLNLINPSFGFSDNSLFIVINGINGAFHQTFSMSVFVLAYLKYSGVKS